MRAVFVDNLLFEQYGGAYHFDLQPHLGLLSLVAVIEEAGHQGVLYDPKTALADGRLVLDHTLYRRMAMQILERAPDVVGFTSLGCNFICTVKVAAHVRRLAPDVPLLLGGPHASILDRETLERWPQFDAVVRGEAESTILSVLSHTHSREFAGVAGVTYRSRGELVANPPQPLIADLDTLPRPAYDHHPIERLGLKTLRVEAGRGCPFSCTFCSTASFFGRKYRLKSANHLCQELDHLHRRYGVSDFALTHDLFTVSKDKVREFCDAVQDRGYTWTCSARMDCVNPELLDRMSAAGCRSIYYGVETGSPRMQEVVRKRLDLELFFPTLAHTHSLGMRATASFITGYPEEEQEDQDRTLDLIGSCFYECPEHLMVQLHLLTPEPGTRLAAEFREELEYDGHISDFNFPTLEADDADAMRLDPEVFVNHHYYRSRVPRERHILATSVYPVLYKLGFPVLRYLLSDYEHRLSLLIAHLAEWAREQGESRPYGADFLCRFMASAWGEEHHLTSLVRYMVTADQLRLPDSPASGAPNGGSYVVSSAVAVLRDLHDCPAMLSAIWSGAPVSRSASSDRHHYLLLLNRSDERTVRNFKLNDATVELIEGFRRPRPLGNADAQKEVGHLLRLGVLHAVANGAGDGHV
jgi:radical SAM superfamily enzyme YgiQ (UPF0313 family)